MEDDGRSRSDPERALAETGAALWAMVVAAVPQWVEGSVTRVLDAWEVGRPGAVDRGAAQAAAAAAGRHARAEVARRLGELLSADSDAQRTTPLAVVRDATAHPAGVLDALGVAPVVRDRFDEERFPHDVYALTPASLATVHRALGPPALAWGAAKAAAHRARHGERRRPSP